jgi:hypothetical protein
MCFAVYLPIKTQNSGKVVIFQENIFAGMTGLEKNSIGDKLLTDSPPKGYSISSVNH